MKVIILALMFCCGSKPRVDMYAEKPWRIAYRFEQYCYEPIFFSGKISLFEHAYLASAT